MAKIHPDEWYRENPIFGTDFSKHPAEVIEDIRKQLGKLRGQLSDLGFGYSGWSEQLATNEAGLTLVISDLYGIMNEMQANPLIFKGKKSK